MHLLTESVHNPLLDVYHRLFTHYGPQHWWPAQDPFEVMVGAVLTQGTSWHNVERCIANLRQAGLLSPACIRELPLDELARLLYPSGYYNVKAYRLRSLCLWLGLSADDDIERLKKRDTASLREELLQVYGIGPETADCILLYALEKPVFVVDSYTRRILDRLGLAPQTKSYRSYQLLFQSHLPSSVWLFNEFHALLVALGKDTCRKRRHCEGCCLSPGCPTGARVGASVQAIFPYP